MKQKKKNIKKLPLIFGGILLAVAVLFTLLELTHVIDFVHRAKAPITDPAAIEQQSAAKVESDKKKDLIEHPTSTSGSPGPSPTTMTIDLSARSESNGTITVLTKLFGVSNGSCSLDINNNGKHSRQTVDVIYQSEYSSCAGFSVPVSDIGSGDWTITLTVNSNGQVYNKSINFQVR